MNDDDEVALIFIGNETPGHAGEYKISETEAGEKKDGHRQFMFQQVMQQGAITAGEGDDAVIKFLQHPDLFPVAATQKDGRQYWRQGEGVEGGNGNGKRDRQRELAKQNACCPGKERNRHKHGTEHQRSGDDSAGDLGSGFRRRFMRVVFASSDVALDIFNHDDGVVDYEAGREGNAKQCQGVDGEAE